MLHLTTFRDCRVLLFYIVSYSLHKKICFFFNTSTMDTELLWIKKNFWRYHWNTLTRHIRWALPYSSSWVYHYVWLLVASATIRKSFIDEIEKVIERVLPAIQAVMRLVTIPPNRARSTIWARSPLRLGAIGPRAPSWIPIELRLANPHRA